MKVLIRSPIRTSQTHTVTEDMTHMVGKKYNIEKIKQSYYGLAAVIHSYYWHPEDLEYYELPYAAKKKKPLNVCFDVKELII